jgi:peptidoglycan/LPS O-acetylase OafA/YrhL
MGTSAAAHSSVPRLTFRTDIEGLRAVAVVLVIALHFGVTALGGGYVGVDVFFVISGFLITSLLIDEVGHSGRVSLRRFYARRARRILPLACLVVCATVLATYLQLGPVIGRTAAVDGKWTAVFAANIRLIHQGTDYFARGLAPSPLQHYWSLAVEEQFYIVWPTVVFLLMWAGRRANRSALVLRGGLTLLAAASLYWSIHETSIAPSTAYFSPFTRAWELGAGALAATLVAPISRAPQILRSVATWLGLVLIAVSAFAFSAATPFPGDAAVLPVLGAGLVVAGGSGQPRGGAGVLLGVPPMRWLGRISFSLYLWHWPVLVIAEGRADAPLSGAAELVCAAITLGLSVVTYYAVEHPLRSAPSSRARREHSIRASAWGPIVLGAVAICVAFTVSALTENRAAFAIRNASTSVAEGSSTLTVSPSLDRADQLASLQRQVHSLVQEGLALQKVPANVDPPVLALSKDGFVSKYVKCMQSAHDTIVKTCTFGSPKSRRLLVVFGDSHAMTWMPALDAFGREAGYRVVTLYKAACPVPDVDIFLPTPLPNRVRTPFPQCTLWRGNALRHISTLKPAAVFLSFNQEDTNRAGKPDVAHWSAGLKSSLQQILESGARVVEIENNTDLQRDPVACLSRAHADPRKCTGTATNAKFSTAERLVAHSQHVPYIDTQQWFCASGRCPVIIDNRLVYHDFDHVTAQYVADLEPLLAASLRANGL